MYQIIQGLSSNILGIAFLRITEFRICLARGGGGDIKKEINNKNKLWKMELHHQVFKE